MLNPEAAVEATRDLLTMRDAEAERLDRIHTYWRGEQPLPIVPNGVPPEVKNMAEMSRINVCGLVVNVPAQSMYVTGIKDDLSGENDPVWEVWQANRMDRHQAAIHRAALAYGTSYMKVLPGDPAPVMRGVSPRRMTAAYAYDDQDWPELALEVTSLYRLYDTTHLYILREDALKAKELGRKYEPEFVSASEHGAGVCPIVRFRNLEDLEDEPSSEIEAIAALQDQLDFTTFDMLVAQHFGAFRQRYILGWTSPSENETAKAAASRLWTFDDDGKNITVGEFSQTDLAGYLSSRKSTLEHFGVISQVPPHNLVGQMINLSAEALVAAEVGANRKNTERETSFGESHEQGFWLAARYRGEKLGDGAQVRWRETEARSLAQTVDALGKMAKMLGVPVEALWERIPGVTQQDVDEWKTIVSTDELNALFAGLDSQQEQSVPDEV